MPGSSLLGAFGASQRVAGVIVVFMISGVSTSYGVAIIWHGVFVSQRS